MVCTSWTSEYPKRCLLEIVGVASLSTRFSTGTTGLETELLASSLQSIDTVLGPSGQVNVDGGTHTSTQVGGARVNITEFGGDLEILARFSLDGVTDTLDASGESFKDSLDISSLLHGDDTELILLIDPDQEGLIGIVEDTTAFGPIALHTSNLQVGVTRHEQEMVIDELLTNSLIHASQWAVFTSKITSHLSQSVAHQSFNIDTLLFGDSGGETESLDGTSDTDSARVNGNIGFNVSGNLGGVHVRDMFEVCGKAMVFTDQRIKDISKVNVGILITSIDTAMLVVEINGTSDSLSQGEARGLGHMVSKFSPFGFGNVGSYQRVFGSDFWERCHVSAD